MEKEKFFLGVLFIVKEVFVVRGLFNSGGFVVCKDCIVEEDVVVVGCLW